MYTLKAVFAHFSHFIDLKINFLINPYNLILGALCFNQRGSVAHHFQGEFLRT